jgi:GT2 family glycosyltransferase
MPRYVQLRRVSADLYRTEAIFNSSRANGIHAPGEEVVNLPAPAHLTNDELLRTMYRNGKWIASRVFPGAKKPVVKIEPPVETLDLVVPSPEAKPAWADLPPLERLKAWVSSWSNPKLSILIPSQDRLDLLLPCLLSLEETTRGHSVEVVIGDSGSNQQTFDFYRDIGLRVVQFSQPFNFSVVCNGLASVARGEWILFLNNDTKALTKGWPTSLIGREGEVIGCVLVHHNAPDLIHHAGLDIGPHPDPGNVIPFYSGHLGHRRPLESLDRLGMESAIAQTGAFLFMSKKVFDLLGGFDVAYRLDLQDADFGIRARELGFRVSCTKSVLFSHVSSGSRTDEQRAFPVNNWKFFSGRRGRSIREWSESKKVTPRREMGRVLIIDDHVPDPDQGFHIPRAKNILDFMVELGYRVTFFQTCHQNVTPQWLDHHLFRGVEVVTSDPNFSAFAKERAGFYDKVFISRPHNLRRFHNISRLRFPRAKIIYDSEALFYIREKLKAKLFGINMSLIEESERVELDQMCLADRIISVSNSEKKIIEKERPVAIGKTSVWGHPLPLKPTKNEFYQRRGILFTGNLNVENPNEDSIIWFCEKVWPTVQKALGCSLAITGSLPSERVFQQASDSVLITGYLSSEELARYYDGYRVFIVPTRFAAGISQKLHESMSYGIPAVSSSLIASQLDLVHEKNVLVGKSPEDFAEQVIRLYTDGSLWGRIRSGGLDFIKNSCDPETMKRSLRKIIEE